MNKDQLIENARFKAASKVDEHFEYDPEKYNHKAILTSTGSINWSQAIGKNTKSVIKTQEQLPKVQNITGEEYKNIKDYTSYGSHILSPYLLNKHRDYTPETLSRIHSLDRNIGEFLSRAPKLPQDLHVYSGTQKFNPSTTFEKGNGVIHMPHYVSTSLDIEQANRHIGQQAGHILHFHLPKDYDKGAEIAQYSGMSSEQEFILNKNQKWKLHGKTEYQHKGQEGVNLENPLHTTVWHLKPHDENVNEAYEHPASDETMTNTRDKTPAVRQSKDPQYANEHNILSDLHDPITAKYASTVHRMTNASHMINSDLLEGNEVHPMWRGVHNKLTDMFSETPALEREHHVYSGMGDFDPHVHFAEKRGYFFNKSYVSGSIAPEVAIRHSNLKAFGTDHEHILHFVLPAGYKGAHYIANYSPFQGEHEMLIKPRQRWKLMSQTKYSVKRSDGSSGVRSIWTVKPHG